MTLHDKTFSLFDFKKKAEKVQIFDERTIDEEGNIIPFVDQAAYLTHYFHLKDSGVQIPYIQKAEDILSSWTEFVSCDEFYSNADSVGCESNVAYQQYFLPLISF